MRGTSLTATVRDAAEALRREGFAQRVAHELAELRADGEQWTSYLAEAEATSAHDGIG